VRQRIDGWMGREAERSRRLKEGGRVGFWGCLVSRRNTCEGIDVGFVIINYVS
jgi:hypothetical protein